MNKGFISGNLCADPERVDAGGKTLCKFRIGNNDWAKKGDPDNKGVVFVDCEAWEKTADFILEGFRKGDRIFLEYRTKMDVWDDKNGGGRRTKLVFVVERFDHGGPKADRAETRETRRPEPAVARTGASSLDSDDDIPF